MFVFPANVRLPYVLLASVILFFLAVKMAMTRQKNKYCGFFLTQFFLFLSALLFSWCWFFTGKEITPLDHWVWTILQRGSLAAIETSAGILGIGNFLFVWIYSERDKLTLGKSLSDLISRQMGNITYTLSVIVHFVTTVLCPLLAKIGAREGALLSFLTLIAGCILQAMVCFRIALNREERERLAIEAWKAESIEGCYLETPVIANMTEFLRDPVVYTNQKYRETLFLKIAEWMEHFPQAKEHQSSMVDQEKTSSGVHVSDKEQMLIDILSWEIRAVSSRLRAIMEKIPSSERPRFSESLVDYICQHWDSSYPTDKSQENFCHTQADLLACGYFHFLYSISGSSEPDSAIEPKIDFIFARISALTYFSSNRGQISVHITAFFHKLLIGMEWYLFLTQRTTLPRYTSYQSQKVCEDDGDSIFTALIHSIFDMDNLSKQTRIAAIAWTQVT